MNEAMDVETNQFDNNEISTCALLPPDWEVSSSAIYNDGISDFFVIVCQIPLTKLTESWPLCPGCTASVVIKDGMMNMTVRIPAWECPAYVS